MSSSAHKKKSNLILSVTEMPAQRLLVFGTSHETTSPTEVVSELTRLHPTEIAIELCPRRYRQLFWFSNMAERLVPNWDRKLLAKIQDMEYGGDQAAAAWWARYRAPLRRGHL